MLVIRGAEVFTAAGKTYKKGDVLIDGGKILEVAENISAADVEVLNAEGLFVMPGIVDAHSHVGGFGSTMDDQDLNEMTSNITPQVEAIYAIDTQSKQFERIIKAGITTSVILPGSGNVVGGMACAMKSHGRSISDMCIRNPVALKMALGGNPKGVYGKAGKAPMTRMAIAQIIRELFINAQEYMKKKETAGDDKDKLPAYDAGLENAALALRREIHVKVHCEQFDMMTLLRIAKEFDLDFTLEHAWGASDYYDEIAESGVRGVVFGPIGVQLTPGECGKVDIESLVELDRRGVCCAIMTDGPIMNPEMLVFQAGEVMRFGGELERVLNMITINAAKIIGVDEQIGSLEPGKDADIVIFKGVPAIDVNAKALYTIINGTIVHKAV